MKNSSVVRMTFFENASGQIFWITFGVALACLLMTGLVSQISSAHQTRLIDTGTYFLIDIVVFLTAVLLGSSLFSKDFSNRGLAEIIVPEGTSRTRLLLLRGVSHVMCLWVITVALFGIRLLTFAANGSWHASALADSTLMLVFVLLKTALAFSVAMFLGCVVRPVIALLGTIFFFGLGHFAMGIQSSAGFSDDAALIPWWSRMLLRALRIWNPNFLVLESLRGDWEVIPGAELTHRLAWGLCATALFTFAALLAVRKRDIDALRL